MKTYREKLIEVLNFRDKIFYQENEFTENEEIVDLFLKLNNSNSQDELKEENCEHLHKFIMPSKSDGHKYWKCPDCGKTRVIRL